MNNINSNTPELDRILGRTASPISATPTIDDFLDSPVYTDEETPTPQELKIIQLEEGEIDPRVKLLSHSSRTLLHTCPRKYQLYRLSATKIVPVTDENIAKEQESQVTFAYGHAVGIGVQSVLENKSGDQIILDTFLGWSTDLLANTPRHNKSIWTAMFAVQQFLSLRNTDLLKDYSLVYYQNKPAVELSFQINLPNNFKYRGSVDAVLQHNITKEVIVLENKTSSMNTNSAQYKNSGQALGYSVVLDILFPSLSSYSVLYMVYETKAMSYKHLVFHKSLFQRAVWLQELIIDTEVISLYEKYEVYPMCGHSCFNYFKECEYLGTCTLETANLVKPLTQKILDDVEKDGENYQFHVDFYDLVQSQAAKI